MVTRQTLLETLLRPRARQKMLVLQRVTLCKILLATTKLVKIRAVTVRRELEKPRALLKMELPHSNSNSLSQASELLTRSEWRCGRLEQ